MQGLTEKNGIKYISLSDSGTSPSRVWATVDGVVCKIVYEGATVDIKFGAKIIFSDIDDNVFLSDGSYGQSNDVIEYWILKTAA